MIHPTAIIHPGARVDPTCHIGAYSVIDADVTMGPDCRVGPHVHITGHTRIGSGNQFHSGCVIGDAPQDIKYKGEPTRLVVGDRNRFREHVTVHRSNSMSEDTVIGSDNFLMAHSHVGHNSRVGNGVVLVNGALVAGHVEIGDRAIVSGNCLIHQFVRIGTLSMMQGRAGIGKDLPPFTVARGVNRICGLNSVGLRRAGIGAADRLELKGLYHLLFRRGLRMEVAIEEGRSKFGCEAARIVLDFVETTKRGVCADVGMAASDERDEAD